MPTLKQTVGNNLNVHQLMDTFTAMNNPCNGMHRTIKIRQIYMQWHGNKVVEELAQQRKRPAEAHQLATGSPGKQVYEGHSAFFPYEHT